MKTALNPIKTHFLLRLLGQKHLDGFETIFQLWSLITQQVLENE
jgi:hypothetical protein